MYYDHRAREKECLSSSMITINDDTLCIHIRHRLTNIYLYNILLIYILHTINIYIYIYIYILFSSRLSKGVFIAIL